MENNFYVYAHYDEENNLRYIGKGSRNRAFRHDGRSKLWKQVFPNGPHRIDFIAKGLSETKAFKLEEEMILESIKNGEKIINLSRSNKGGATWNFSDETKDYISRTRSGENHYMYGKKHKKETLDKIKKTKSENQDTSIARYWKGKKRDDKIRDNFIVNCHSQESIKKRSEKMRGRVLTEEHKTKISIGLSNHNPSEEEKKERAKKISKAKKGRPNGLKGKKFTDEHRLKISASHMGKTMPREGVEKQRAKMIGRISQRRRAVKCMDNGKIYDCAKICGIDLNISEKGIQRVCSKKRKTYKGMRFNYI
jgi:hypothetical protein